jgi:hypothetical protein
MVAPHMRRRVIAFAGLAFIAAQAQPAASRALVPERVKAGILACDISAGLSLIITSKKNLTCMFTPSQPGTREVYIGSIGKFRLDPVAAVGGEMIWVVYVPSNKHFGALAGHYSGAPAELMIGGSLGAKVLVGGVARTVALQPLLLQGETALNVAPGVVEFDLRPAR